MTRQTTPGRLLTLLHREGTLTRAEATARLDTARSAVGEAVAELVRLGLVQVGDEASSPRRASAGRGRSSPLLSPARTGPVAVAAFLHPAGADLALLPLGAPDFSPGGTPVERVPVAWTEEGVATALGRVAGRIRELLAADARSCAGVGIGVSGIVDADDRTVLNALYLGWDEVPVAELVEAELGGITVAVYSDAELTGLAEFRRGAGRGAASTLTLSCEHVGIGGALLSSGGDPQPLEAGHLVLDPFGPPCPCGQRGCLELYCDGRALVRAAGGSGEEDDVRVREVVAAARAGDPAARRAVQDTANRLGTGLVSLVNVLAPDRVVLAGLLADQAELAGPELALQLRASLVARLRGTTLHAATVRHPVLVGAAERVFAPLLHDPVGRLESCS